MNIAYELMQLVANRDAIKVAIDSKNPTIPPTDALSSFPAAISSIPTDSPTPPTPPTPTPEGPWTKPEMWPDIKAILSADTHDYPYKRIELLNDQQLATYATGAIAFYTSEGNFYSSPRTFTWDPANDIVASDGSRYRWVISFSNNGYFNNLCGANANLLWYVLTPGSYCTHGFSGKFLCQKLEGEFRVTGGSMFANMTSLEEIEGSISATQTNCNTMCESCTRLRILPDDISLLSATSTNSMFNGCRSLKQLPSTFRVPNT